MRTACQHGKLSFLYQNDECGIPLPSPVHRCGLCGQAVRRQRDGSYGLVDEPRAQTDMLDAARERKLAEDAKRLFGA